MKQEFDQVFSDVAYLPLAAAAAAGIPSVALCSLNWADISQAYLAEMPDMPRIFEQIHTAYAAAGVFLQPTPSMPMPQLACRQAIAPIAAAGRNRRQELNRMLARAADIKLVLLGFGGVAYSGIGQLPRIQGVVWLTPDDWPDDAAAARPDRVSFSRTGFSFLDLLASSDALITKVGYGSFVEATANAIPVLYLDRPDWPETPYLAAWLLQHGTAAAIDEAGLFSEQLGVALHALWQLPRKAAIKAGGAEQAAARLAQHHLAVHR
jgi:UDP:flavonoid glycosyltransferase YjiC (YdhE family)